MLYVIIDNVMKRYVKAATQRTLDHHLINGFIKYGGCSSATIINKSQNNYQMELVLPNNTKTTITVWFDAPTRVQTQGMGTNKPRVTYHIDPNWNIQPNGDVLDASGTLIGSVYAIQLNSAQRVHRMRNDYNLKSIRTDSGDVLIDHPEINKTKIYPDIVNSLMKRMNTQRS